MMESETKKEHANTAAAISNAYGRFAARTSTNNEPDDEDDEVVEQDPEGRFSRYNQLVGSGRFKSVYKAFDERRGVDVAWSKIAADENHLTTSQMHRIVEEMSAGLALDHPHVIKSYQCWEDPSSGCINMITEFFTSGNLRDYRRRHKALDIKAVKKWGRQILQGLAYLHQRDPPVVHGDLRPDKIYINGHSGEIKIGDLGLSVLVPKRFAPGVMPEGDPSNQYTRAVDIFAFGLVMLELVAMKKMDRFNTSWSHALDGIGDASTRAFIEKCLAPIEERPSATELLKDPFLSTTTKASSGGVGGGGGGGIGGGSSHGSLVGIGHAGSGAAAAAAAANAANLGVSRSQGSSMGDMSAHHYHRQEENGMASSSSMAAGGASRHAGSAGDVDDEMKMKMMLMSTGDERTANGPSRDQRRAPGQHADAVAEDDEQQQQQQRAECEAGSVRGEDYLFQFSGKIRDGKLHFRLNMHYEGDGDDEVSFAEAAGSSKTIDFVYDPEEDTPDEIAAEISSEFNLSPTDRDICAAALKEWLADQGPSTD